MTSLGAKQYLDSFINYENILPQTTTAQFNLDRMKAFLDFLGHPEQDLKCVHVAGTNGKGSTCAFTASILAMAGYKVGLYTSPHLSDFRERIRILDKDVLKERKDFAGMISEAQLCATIEALKSRTDKFLAKKEHSPLTFFEFTTAIALTYFQKRKVDVVVLETGMGGRLDATNAIESIVCGITPISQDHTKHLGKSLKEIAAEKAAIIKDSQQQVVLSPQNEEAQEVLIKRCRAIGVTPVIIGQDILRKTKKAYFCSLTLLEGSHHVVNAATAIGLVGALNRSGFSITVPQTKEGIERTFWPGRCEVISKDPVIVLDGAHNPAGARALTETITHVFPKKDVIIILGISKDKDVQTICQSLKTIKGNTVMITQAQHPRAAHPSQIPWEKYFTNKSVIKEERLEDAFKKALCLAKSNDIILVTGSLFVVGEARTVFFQKLLPAQKRRSDVSA